MLIAKVLSEGFVKADKISDTHRLRFLVGAAKKALANSLANLKISYFLLPNMSPNSIRH